MEQTERERKRTLGNFLKELSRQTKLDPLLKDKLWRFLNMRNKFAHNLSENLSENPGRNLSTEKGATTRV